MQSNFAGCKKGKLGMSKKKKGERSTSLTNAKPYPWLLCDEMTINVDGLGAAEQQ